MKRNRFYGHYYKFISSDGFSFALIRSIANEGKMLQLICKEKAITVNDYDSVKIDGQRMILNIHQDDISLEGFIELGEYHPLKKNVMGPFEHLPIECKHMVVSMYHELNGEITYNGRSISFNKGRGYIEGDKGRNFPKKYIWYNSVLDNTTVTLAVASIPFGLFSFTGILCFIKNKEDEYYMCTYDSAKAEKLDMNEIIIRKGKYKLILSIPNKGGHLLKAPVKGNMNRYIKENISVPSFYRLMYKDQVILENEDELSSLEYMW